MGCLPPATTCEVTRKGVLTDQQRGSHALDLGTVSISLPLCLVGNFPGVFSQSRINRSESSSIIRVVGTYQQLLPPDLGHLQSEEQRCV